MGQRSVLHEKLKEITDNVYFQPPANVQLKLPCIVYRRDYGVTTFANNAPYIYTQRYQVTVIDRDPDNLIVPQIAALPMCVYIRGYAVDNKNHDVFQLYF